MNEEELKERVNSLRHEISVRNRNLKKLYEKLAIQKRDSEEIRGERDKCNKDFKRLLNEMKGFKECRDRMNREIKELKSKHKARIGEVKKLGGEIKKLKIERDRLNKNVRGTEKTLHGKLQDILKELLEKETSVEREEKLFMNFMKLRDRWMIARDANVIHASIVGEYGKIKELESELDGISKQIGLIGKKADECHEKVLTISSEMDGIRKLSDDYHKDLQNRYDGIKPIFDEISAVKEDIKRLDDELGPYNKELENIRLARAEQKKSKAAKDIREKFMSQKRITLDDFRVMLEKEGLSAEQ